MLMVFHIRMWSLCKWNNNFRYL